MSDRPQILDVIAVDYGFAVFEKDNYDLNIIGVRNPDGQPDVYDDQLVICYKVGGKWKEERFKCTTDPGLYWMNKSGMRGGGVAIKQHPQQMRGAYSLGLHAGKYEALRQTKPIKIWRDGNLDNRHDHNQISDTGIFGCNIHRSSAWRDTEGEPVGRYSAGCTVIADPADFERLLWLCKKQIEHHNWQRFTYTLICGDY